MKESYIGLPSYDRLSFEAHDALRRASYASKAFIDRIGRGVSRSSVNGLIRRHITRSAVTYLTIGIVVCDSGSGSA